MKAAPFDYVRATALNDVFDAFERHGDEAQIVAGGQSLMPILNMRLAAPRVLVDINHVAALDGISLAGDRLRIGALSRHRDLSASTLVAKHAPLLALADTIGADSASASITLYSLAAEAIEQRWRRAAAERASSTKTMAWCALRVELLLLQVERGRNPNHDTARGLGPKHRVLRQTGGRARHQDMPT